MSLAIILAGRIMVLLAQTNPVIRDAAETNHYTAAMIECDLCTGFWVYLLFLPPVYPALGRVGSAALSAFLAHIFVLGLKFRFGVDE